MVALRLVETVDAVLGAGEPRVLVRGSVLCKVDSPGLPDVSVVLSAPRGVTVEPVSVHASVHEPSSTPSAMKFSFTPPAGWAEIYRWRLADTPALPVTAGLQARLSAPNEVRVLLQVRAASDEANRFDMLEVTLPLPGRGRIKRTHVLSPSLAGAVRIGADRASLIWTFGSKIPGRNREASLPCSVVFDGGDGGDEEGGGVDLTMDGALGGAVGNDGPAAPLSMAFSSGAATEASPLYPDALAGGGGAGVTALDPPPFDVAAPHRDAFLLGEGGVRCCAHVRFKQSGAAAAQVTVDAQHVMLFPNMGRANTTVHHTVRSGGTFVVWNSEAPAKRASV